MLATRMCGCGVYNHILTAIHVKSQDYSKYMEEINAMVLNSVNP
jgi:hypothetical protein